MKLRHVVTTLVALLLAGCGHMYHRPPCDCNNGGGSPPDPTRPQVNVVGGKITVDADPLVFGEGLRNIPVTIVWALPKDSPYRFGKDGIVFKDAGEEIVRCVPLAYGTSFSCLNRHTKPGRYKYDIRVEPANDKAPPVAPYDPHVVNN
jgi:hypothetical protein